MEPASSPSGTAMDAVRSAIREHGPIGFDAYMELALYGHGGYYERVPIGPGGDFVTSPHVHAMFGRFMAEAVRELHRCLGSPRPLHLIEAGAGDGTLLTQILDALGDETEVAVTTVERSDAARDALAGIEGVRVARTLGEVPPGPAVVLAHELLDNLAFLRFRGTAEGTREVRVGDEDGRLVEVLTEPGAEPDPWPGSPIPPGGERVLPVGARRFVAEATDPAGGPRALLAVDYGREEPDAGEVHGYRDHRVVEDVLGAPGATDITAGVPFGDLRDHLRGLDRTAFPTVSQGDALRALGFETWFTSALERQGDLLATGRGAEAVRVWGGRSRASLLVDPAHLGRFRWMVAGPSGMPEPSWLSEARRDAG